MPIAPSAADEPLPAARQVVARSIVNPTVWANPSIATAVLTTDATAFQTSMQDQIAKKAAAELATQVKTDRKTIIKPNLSRLKYWAEGVVGRNDPRLNKLGFSAPTIPTSAPTMSLPKEAFPSVSQAKATSSITTRSSAKKPLTRFLGRILDKARRRCQITLNSDPT